VIAEYHHVLGILGAVLGACLYAYYHATIWLGRTRPHLFTWLSYGFINGVVFIAQVLKGGGAGSWTMAVATVGVLSVAIVALWKGEKVIAKVDWLSFVGVLIGIMLWIATSDALYAVVIATLINALGFVPTVRKSIYKPWEEPAIGWSLSVLQFGFGAVALESFTLTTALFPIAVAAMNAAFVAMLLIRRRQLAAVNLL